jgi:dihydrodipicolinate synthase/N-acetylneuraminate lyase
MKTTPVTPGDVCGGLMSVPPLARNADLSLNAAENKKLIAHIEGQGVTAHLYGGNANFYAVNQRQFEEALEMLPDLGGANSWFIPSIGPDFGKMCDQSRAARNTRFPTFITLPQAFGTTPDGVEKGIRQTVQTLGRPILLYLKTEGYLTPAHTARLVADGQVCAIKYGINRPDPTKDAYLDELTKTVDRNIIIIVGERYAVGLRKGYRIGAMMSGSGSVAPLASSAMFAALKRDDLAEAERIWAAVKPLEDLRDALGPISVLHDAITLAGIAKMGPLLPLVANVRDDKKAEVEKVARTLLAFNETFAGRRSAAE